MPKNNSRLYSSLISGCFLFSFFASLPASYAASVLAAWGIREDGILRLRTAPGAKLKAFFQHADNKNGDRVWVDFPGELKSPRKIVGNGPIREIRLGKPYPGHTRLVIEFKPYVGLNPSKLKLVGIAQDKWELPFPGMPLQGLNYVGEGLIDKGGALTNQYSSATVFTKNKVSNLPNIIRGKYSVVIDPGHGGPDPGAIGLRGLRESSVVLDVSRQVARILSQKGVRVILTRKSERDLDLYPRVLLANRAKADAFVSIHANATRGYRSDVNGIETYYYSGYRGLKLARSLQKEVLSVSLNSPDRGVRRGRFYVIRNTYMPAALVEIGFVTGRIDSQMLIQPQHRKNLAFAISKGILNYLKGG